MKKRVLVTGHTGFIGKHITAALCGRNDQYEVFTPNFDITKRKQAKRTLAGIKPHVIVHLAGRAVPGTSPENFPAMVKANVVGTQNLISFAPPACRFILASSVVIYGDWWHDPFSSDASGYHEDDPIQPTSVYGITKTAAEELVNYATFQGLVNGIHLRLCAVVGSGLTHGALKDIIRKAADTTQPTLKLMGKNPGSVKPYLDIDNVRRVILNAIEANNIIGPVNVASRDSISIFTMADLVQSFLDVHYGIPMKPREWSGETFAGDNPYIGVDSSFARAHLGLLDIPARYAIKYALVQMQNCGEIFPK